MAIVDDLIANPGTYLGICKDLHGGPDAAARIEVTPLPGGAGVTIDYELFNPNIPERIQGHAERTLLARTAEGRAILVAGHSHADTVAVLRESPAEPGTFVMGDEPSAFPVCIKISMPKPGHLTHSWAYGRPGEEPIERDRAELTLRP